jgi:ankyrin repeat protein
VTLTCSALNGQRKYHCTYGSLRRDFEVNMAIGLHIQELHIAAAIGSIREIEYILRRGAPSVRPTAANVVTSLGFTPLHVAAMRGNIDAVHTLLQLGGTNNAHTHSVPGADDPGSTALHLSIARGHASVAMALLAASAIPNVTNGQQDWPLDICVNNARYSIYGRLQTNSWLRVS